MSLNKMKNGLKKHGGHCSHPRCTETNDLTIDHIIPQVLLSVLGFPDAYKTDDDNLQVLCKKHNQEKGNLLDYTNPKTLPLLKKYINSWIDKHADYFVSPEKRVRKIGVRCMCGVEHDPLDLTKWKNPPNFIRKKVDDDDY